ncbi:DUF2066 domain-containing protein [Thalassotalea sp. PP2-459]|uniref:DUF2066 domain-containing protein n=1 Tax=Thalassotalea sp. PP2-459 TaxID=1742724 RepID=UPI00094286D9|nr:DUF2066 domain-containing protein [Thalassotalea sp. PP2-459]OKY27110.1 hypothetical protein BI291_10185 [Thalassotalea sp. PP2-459]
MVMKQIFVGFTMRCVPFFLVMLFNAIIVKHVNAVEVKDLYLARVEVSNQSVQARNAAFKKALDIVLVKISGQTDILQNPTIKQQRARYQSFVNNFRYERKNDKSLLVVTFDESKINQLFVGANLPIWGSLRPQIVLWVIEEQQLTRNIISADIDNPINDVVKAVEDNRGLPFTLPIMDLLDSNQITTYELWGRFTRPIVRASMRYQPEAIVVVRLSDNSLLSEEQLSLGNNCSDDCQPTVALDWSFLSMLNTDQLPHFGERVYGQNKQTLLAETLSQISDMVAKRYAVTTDMNLDYVIDVANVDSLAKYVEVTQFLSQLSAVKAVKLVKAQGNERRFSLSLLGSEQAFLAALKLNKSLKRYADPLDPTSLQGTPLFYWESL